MNLEAERKLKFDRRMAGRPGWAGEEEFKAELASLPDSAEKAADETDETDDADTAADSDTAAEAPTSVFDSADEI
ncbi:MAG: hypothetical protein OSB70_09850 [Myxococcota bacterium]|nr:hypothetical protein [Myxococcota bacterium]